VSNYELKTRKLVILNGEFVYGKGDLLTTGELVSHPALTSFLLIGDFNLVGLPKADSH
jgi:hypothetical protein